MEGKSRRIPGGHDQEILMHGEFMQWKSID